MSATARAPDLADVRAAGGPGAIVATLDTAEPMPDKATYAADLPPGITIAPPSSRPASPAAWEGAPDGVGRPHPGTWAPSPAPVEPWEAPVPFDKPHLPPFPVDALPPWLAEHVAAVAAATCTPADMAAGAALSVLACACAGHAAVSPKRDWIEPINLFVLIVAASAERKSAVFARMTKPVVEFERAECERLEPEIRQAAFEIKAIAARRKMLDKAAAKAATPDARIEIARELQALDKEASERQPPAHPRYMSDDATPEALEILLATHGGRMAVLSAESEVIDQMVGRYSDKPALNVYLKGHAGEPLMVDRVLRGQGAVYVPRARLTIGVCTQPSVLAGAMANDALRGRGMLARFCYILPASAVGSRPYRTPYIPEAVAERYNGNVAALFRLPLPPASEPPPLLRFGRSADAVFARLYDARERSMQADGDMGAEPLRAWAGKSCGHVARVAALLHLADDPTSAALEREIEADAVERAATIGDYFAAHARAAFATMGASPAVEAARAVLRWIRGHVAPNAGQFTRQGLYQSVRRRAAFGAIEALDAPLQLLETHGWIRRIEATGDRRRGRPASPAYRPHPAIFRDNWDVSGTDTDKSRDTWEGVEKPDLSLSLSLSLDSHTPGAPL